MKKLLLITMLILALTPLTSSAGTETYTLTWDPNSETDLAGYNIYIRVEGDEYVEPLVTITELSQNPKYDGTLEIPEDTLITYYWVATAFDTDDLESDYSNEATRTYDTRVSPDPPQNLTWIERIIAWLKSMWGKYS